MLPNPGLSAVPHHHHHWVERWIAVLVVLNLAFVFFDLTYLNARSLYLQVIFRLVQVHDPVKGIRSHPETQRYSEQVADLESQLAQTDVERDQRSWRRTGHR